MWLLDHTRRNVAVSGECRAAFDWWERFASSRRGSQLMFTWAFAEAIVWPIIPDFLLVPMAVGNRRRFYIPLAAAALGSALGGTALVLFAWWAPNWAVSLLRLLPLVPEAHVEAVRARLAMEGAGAFLWQPWSGIAFKVWAVVAGVERINPWLVIPVFVAARSLRMAIHATAARVLAGWFAGFLRDFSIFLAVIYLVLFFYGWWRLLG